MEQQDVDIFLHEAIAEIEQHNRHLNIYELQQMARNCGGDDRTTIRVFHRLSEYNDYFQNRRAFYNENPDFLGMTKYKELPIYYNQETGKNEVKTVADIKVDYLRRKDQRKVYNAPKQLGEYPSQVA